MSQGQIPGLSQAQPDGDSAPLSEERVREELNRVLASHEFRSSKRSQDFLRYVVENTLAGHGDLLKERTIGIEVFGRSTSYDPSEDATVRVKAGEVRKRLGLYYADQGAHDPIRLELPSGTYVPEFRPFARTETAAPLVPVPHVDITVSWPPSQRFWIFAMVAVILLGAGSFAWMRLRPAATPLDSTTSRS